MKVVAVVPVSGSDPEYRQGKLLRLNNRAILDYTLEPLTRSRSIAAVIVTTDSPLIVDYCSQNFNVILHQRSPDKRALNINEVLRDAWMAERHRLGLAATHILQAWVNYPFRSADLFDRAVEKVQETGVDSLFCVYPEYNTYWYSSGTTLCRTTPDDTNVRAKRRPIYRDLKGLCSLTTVHNIENGIFTTERSALLLVDDFACTVNTHDKQGYYMAQKIAPMFNPQEVHLPAIYEAESEGYRMVVPGRRTVLLASKDLKAGTVLDNSLFYPGEFEYGVSAKLAKSIIGQTLTYDLKKAEPITFGYLS